MSWIENLRKRLAIFASLSLLVGNAYAAPDAPDKGVANEGCGSSEVFSEKILTNVCWDCVLPIRIAGVAISGKTRKNHVPDGAVKKSLCSCADGLGFPHPGIMTQFWEPYRLIEFPRVAGCLMGLNGTRLPFSPTFMGNLGNGIEEGEDDAAFRHYHFYAFPLMAILDMFVPASCNAEGYVDVDIMFLSEIDPTWNNSTLAYFSMPENSLLVTALAATACIPDAISSTLGKPLQPLFWCAGAWGMNYPVTGEDQGSDAINTSSLQTARALTTMHRRGFVKRTMGKDASCGGVVDPTLPKSMYQFTLFDPVPETDSSHVLGESVLTWGFLKLIPAIGEDPSYIVWRWQDCCQTKITSNN